MIINETITENCTFFKAWTWTDTSLLFYSIFAKIIIFILIWIIKNNFAKTRGDVSTK